MASKKTTTAQKPFALVIVTILSTLGLGLSGYLSNQYYQMRSGASAFRSFCNVSASMNCDAVTASPYAEFIAGIPLSSFAAGWYLGLILICLIAMSTQGDWRRESLRAALAMTGVGTIFSLIYLYVMASVMKTYCLFCLGIDAINVISLGLLWMIKPEKISKAPLDFAKWKTMGGVVGGALLVSLVLLKSVETQAIDKTTMNQMIDSVLSSQPVAVEAGPEFPSIGPKNAAVTIVEFSDFQCPHCRRGALILNTVLNRYPNDVRVVLRNFPLDAKCNPLIQGGGHAAACEAAKAAICANKQGKFAEVYEALFDHQTSIAPGKVEKLAQDAGADVGQLAACSAAPETTLAITRDIEEGRRLNINSTPTFFINGHRVEGAYPAPVWNALVERFLKK